MEAPSSGTAQFFSLTVSSAADARRVSRECAIAFYVLAAIQAAAALVLNRSMLIDAAVMAALAAWLHIGRSRIAATLLLILALLGAGVTIMNRLGQPIGGGNNIIVAAIAVWAALKAVVAMFRSRRAVDQGDDADEA
jgi:hypothetical protein